MDISSPAGPVGTRQVYVMGAALAVAGLVHVPPTGHHLADAPYMGVGFVGFTLACLALLLGLSARPGRGLLLAVAGLCGSAVVVYAATRLVAFPGLAHDVGAWADPLGLIAVTAELAATTVALTALRPRRVPCRSVDVAGPARTAAASRG